MTDLTYFDTVFVELVDQMGDDTSIAKAARVSVVGLNEVAGKIDGLINYLMRKKHGSPFEHTSMTFRVKAPIFVFREIHRHRAGFSYNEMSGRYTELPGEFYIPAEDRPLVNVGSSANPKFEPGARLQVRLVQRLLPLVYRVCWKAYKTLLKYGIGNEIARLVLPVGIFSQMYMTFNLRAAFNFLALRTSNPEATFPSNPQFEIELVARAIEDEVAKLFPIAYNAWVQNGRVAP